MRERHVAVEDNLHYGSRAEDVPQPMRDSVQAIAASPLADRADDEKQKRQREPCERARRTEADDTNQSRQRRAPDVGEHEALELKAKAKGEDVPFMPSETWPMTVRFFIAPSPPNETTRTLRQKANLPPATAGEETLAPLVLDLRSASPFHAWYAMRGVCEVETRPQPTVAGLCEEEGKHLTTFLETFCNKIQPSADAKLDAGASPYLEKRVCTRIE